VRPLNVADERRANGSERRRVPRYSPDQLSEAVFVIGSRLVTVGAHGLMLEAPVPLPAGAPLRIHLVVSGMKAEVDVRVRSCVARTQGARWGLGVEFERISVDARERLQRALVTARSGSA
jgi:hypothetical protein